MATTRLHLGQRLLGARPSPAGGTSFRVWAPQARKVAVRLHEDDFPLATAVGGLWEGELDAAPGDDYLLVLDDGDAWPDPHSLWQPGGVRGQSRVLDVSSFEITPGPALRLDELVLYEIHVGTFSAEGTFEGVIP